MGKGTDKLYITHSEWSSSDAYSASTGNRSSASNAAASNAPFKRLPFNFCAISLQPFEHPVCTASGIIFDLTNILPWLKKHGTNPVDGTPLKRAELRKLHFARNEDGEYVDPVTYKVFTDNTHIVALGNSGNVFAWDTVERLNIKAKNWRDLVSDEEFGRKDIITIQDPQNVEARNLSGFKFLRDGEKTLTEEQERERASGVNEGAMGSAAKILKAKEAVAKARSQRSSGDTATNGKAGQLAASRAAGRAGNNGSTSRLASNESHKNAARYTTGKAAASFTSTGLTPHTSGERAILSEEEFMLKPKRIKIKGYARMQTSHGDLTLELYPEHAPKAVWNLVQLAKKGYYRNLPFHRNIRNFMIQGGDPTGSGRGGTSIWGKNFEDELENPLTHSERGTLSMANKGRNTNSSQFFITYRAAKHLDNKHTIFGRVVGGNETLDRLEAVKTDDKDRPTEECVLQDVVVFVDPFEEWRKERRKEEESSAAREAVERAGGTEDDNMTWTGKRIRKVAGGGTEVVDEGGGVGKYLKQALAEAKSREREEDEIVGFVDDDEEKEPAHKKAKSGRFGDLHSW